MGNNFIAFAVAAGAAGWVYNKTMRSTGGNTKNALIVGAVAGLFVFVIVRLILGLIPSV